MGIRRRTKKKLFKGGSGYETQQEYDELQGTLERESTYNRNEREKKERLRKAKEEREEQILNSKLQSRSDEMRHECSLLVNLFDKKVKKGTATKEKAKKYSNEAFRNKNMCDKDLRQLKRITESCYWCKDQFDRNLVVKKKEKDEKTPEISEDIISQNINEIETIIPRRRTRTNTGSLISPGRLDLLERAADNLKKENNKIDPPPIRMIGGADPVVREKRGNFKIGKFMINKDVIINYFIPKIVGNSAWDESVDEQIYLSIKTKYPRENIYKIYQVIMEDLTLNKGESIEVIKNSLNEDQSGTIQRIEDLLVLVSGYESKYINRRSLKGKLRKVAEENDSSLFRDWISSAARVKLQPEELEYKVSDDKYLTAVNKSTNDSLFRSSKKMPPIPGETEEDKIDKKKFTKLFNRMAKEDIMNIPLSSEDNSIRNVYEYESPEEKKAHYKKTLALYKALEGSGKKPTLLDMIQSEIEEI